MLTNIKALDLNSKLKGFLLLNTFPRDLLNPLSILVEDLKVLVFNLDDFYNFISEKAGIKAKAKVEKNFVKALSSDNFDSLVKQKNVFVKFFAPW